MSENKILYLYGTGRDASTRTARRGNFPRETAPRVGPWVVRPARAVAVQIEQLAAYRDVVIEKVEHGTVRVQTADGTPLSIEEIRATLGGGKPDYSTMEHAELLSIVRSDAVTVEVLAALADKTPMEDRRALFVSLRPNLERLATVDRAGLASLNEKLLRAQDAWEEEKAQKAQEARAAEHRAAQEAEEKAREEQRAAAAAAAAASTLPAPPSGDPEDQMDAPGTVTVEAEKVELGSSDAPEAVVDGEKVKEQLGEVVASMEAAAPATNEAAEDSMAASDAGLVSELAGTVEGRELPENWRTMSNTKLMDIFNSKGIPMPEKKNKSGLVEALEKWQAGS